MFSTDLTEIVLKTFLPHLCKVRLQNHIIVIILCICCLPAVAQVDTLQQVRPGRQNSAEQRNKPYLVLISIDGMRHDYIEKHGATHLAALAKSGVQARHITPSFPSYTFPNHYTVVTGLYPSHHGLVSNYFYDRNVGQRYSMRIRENVKDPRWYGGVPLWLLAEQQKMLTASFYWVGTEAPIGGLPSSYYYYYNEKIGIDDRIKAVADWLRLPEEKRPHFISFYFPEVDHAGHSYGPDAAETRAAVRFVDTSIYKLVQAVRQTGLDVNFIVTSDHGMSAIARDQPLKVPVIDTSKFVMVAEDQLLQIYARPGVSVDTLYQRLKSAASRYNVYRRSEVPARWRFGKEDDCFNRVGDLVVVPEWPYAFSSRGRPLSPGAHGYDPYRVKEMRTIFIGWGPAFHSNKVVRPAQNIHIYPVAARILQLPYTHPIDGDDRLAKKVLKQGASLLKLP